MSSHRPRKAYTPRPLDSAKLDELALAYVARFAANAHKLEAYLVRKVRERGWAGEEPADPDAIVDRFVDLGYIDDAAWAQARSDSLVRRGYGARRVGQALHAAGIAEDIRAAVAPDHAAGRRAAVALARKRRFGPWGAPGADRAAREKQIAAMLRAGHGFAAARAVIEAPDIRAAEQWADEAEETE